MEIKTVGIDLAKNVFQIHGMDERGKPILRKQLKRDQVAVFFANLPPCLIGMEACSSAHHWARKLEALGHSVRLIAPQFVKPYIKSNKNDAADAEATRIHLWMRLALRLWVKATLAIEVSGCAHSAMTWALKDLG